MFLIPTYLAASEIHGTGVFAAAPIRKGTLIWRFDPATDWQMTPAELDQFPEPYRSRLRTYSYMDDSGMYVLCGDNAKFMNHADAPNCDDTTDEGTIALRDIAAHEELTCDYRSIDVELRQRIGALYLPENGIELKKTG